MTPRPDHPAGPYVPQAKPSPTERAELINVLRDFPARLRKTVAGLTEAQLDTKYRNWTIRQIVNHLADSHLNGYVRLRLALTEDQPTIKPYDESAWSNLSESRTTNVQISLQLLEALHARLVCTLETMSESEFARTYFHPEHQRLFSLGEFLGNYAWHSRHHLGQIELVVKELR
jgi:hypothetical protein